MKKIIPSWLTDELIFRLKSVYRLALNETHDNHYKLGNIWPAIGTKQLDIHDALLSDTDLPKFLGSIVTVFFNSGVILNEGFGECGEGVEV